MEVENGSIPLENSRWEKFCLGLLEGMSQGGAYIAAGYSARGHVADSAAARLLTNVEIVARLNALKAKDAASTVLSRQRVLEVLSKIILGDSTAETMGKFGPEPIGVTWPARIAAIKQLSVLEGWEKQQAAAQDSGLKELSKHFAEMREKRGADAVDTD